MTETRKYEDELSDDEVDDPNNKTMPTDTTNEVIASSPPDKPQDETAQARMIGAGIATGVVTLVLGPVVATVVGFAAAYGTTKQGVSVASGPKGDIDAALSRLCTVTH